MTDRRLLLSVIEFKPDYRNSSIYSETVSLILGAVLRKKPQERHCSFCGALRSASESSISMTVA